MQPIRWHIVLGFQETVGIDRQRYHSRHLGATVPADHSRHEHEEVEGHFQRLSGQGTAFLEIDGSAVEYELSAGQQIVVDTGYLAAMEGSCGIEVRTVPGIKNMVFGGEGIFNTVVTGPGRIWLQTMPISNVAQLILSFMPPKS